MSAKGDSTPHWLEVRSPNFIVLTDSNEKEARHIAGQFERMRSLFQQVLPHGSGDAGSPIVVLALKDRKGFQSLEPAVYLAKGALPLDGLFLRTQDQNYILLRLDAEGEHPFAVVYHEYTHFVLRKADWLPLWLNEGLAEFYQNTDIRDKDVLLGQPSVDDILYLRENKLLPLPVLFAVDHGSPYYHDEQKGSVFYAESWALTHYIRITDFENKTDRLHDYAALLIKHEDPVTAARQAFGDLNQLQKTLDNYVQNGDYKLFHMKMAFTADEASFQLAPVSLPDVNAVRADVLANSDRLPEAQALLQTVLRDDPKNAQAHETMGDMALRDHDMAAARKWYGEAVQLGSQSPMAHYYFAVFSMQAGDTGDAAAIEASLQQAIKLDPSFAPAYGALVQFYGMNHEKLDEAYVDSIYAINLDPANINYRLNAAQVRMEQRNYDAAMSVLQAALRNAHDPANIAIVNSRIQQVQNFLAMQSAHQSGEQTASTNNMSQAPTSYTSQTMVGGKPVLVEAPPEDPKYPTEPPTGSRHTVRGMMHDVHCFYPKGITLDIQQAGKTVSLYSNDLYKIALSTATPTVGQEIDACAAFEGKTARVEYAAVTDKRVAGQIVAIEIVK